MATKPKAVPQVDPEMTSEVTPKAASGPVIEYIGDGAEKVKFTINPKATRYVVTTGGLVKEYL